MTHMLCCSCASTLLGGSFLREQPRQHEFGLENASRADLRSALCPFRLGRDSRERHDIDAPDLKGPAQRRIQLAGFSRAKNPAGPDGGGIR